MAYKLTEIPDFVSPSFPGDTEKGTSSATEEAVACDTNFCLRYQSTAISFKLPAPVDNTANLYEFHSSIRERLTRSSENSGNTNKYSNNELQLNIWPLITSGQSVTVIGPHGSGKTTAYVLSLLNRLQLGGYLQSGVTADKMAAKASPLFQPQRICGSKIYAIVLTDSRKRVASVHGEFLKWLRILMPQPKIETEEEKKNEKIDEFEGNFDKAAALERKLAKRNQYSIRVNQLHEKSPMADYFDVVNGCAVLIATAAALTKLIRMELISVNDNEVLIIDHADELINSASKDVVELFGLTGSPRYNFVGNRQTMLFAQNWTPNVGKFFFSVQHKPTLVLSSLYDATILFKQATVKIELCPAGTSAIEKAALRVINDELLDKDRVLLELGGEVAITGAVICKNYSQIESLKALLDSTKYLDRERLQLFVLKESTTASEMNRISVDLLTGVSDRRSSVKLVLLTIDDVFTFAQYFRKVNCILHLDQRFDQHLPTAMNYRFLLAYDQFIGAGCGQTDGAEEKFQMEQLARLKNDAAIRPSRHHILNYFFLSPAECTTSHGEERFNQTVVGLLEYSGQLNDGTLKYAMNQHLADFIQTSIECDICPQFAAFGKCKARDKGLKCWKGRHTLTRQLDCGLSEHNQKKIKANTQIWFNISHVVDPNQFFIHLLAYRSVEQATGEWVFTEHHQEMTRLKTILARFVLI